MNRTLFFILFYLFVLDASAQEMWGFSNSNFSGNMGIYLNPSVIVAAPYKYEFHLISGDVFAQNTYGYVPRSHDAIMNAIKGKSSSVPGEKDFYDVYNDHPQTAYAHANITGPAFFKNDGMSAWGVHLGFRNEASASNVYSPVVKFVYEKYDYLPFVGQHFSGGDFSTAYLSWGELGGTYGKVISERNDGFLKVAGTLNFLAGFDGMYMDVRKVDFSVYDSSTAVIHTMDATIAHALASNGSTGFGSFVTLRGIGASTTLGATYIRHRNRGGFDCNKTSDNIRKYQYRIGLSLMDFGFIRFNDQAQMLNLNTTTDKFWSRIDTLKFHSFGHLDSLLSGHVNGSTGTMVNESFNMYLPSAISIQFDYSFSPHVYGNISLVNRIFFTAAQVARGNQMDLSLRYEKRRWEVTGDFTLYEYKVPEVGLGFRYWIFVLGTDRLMELLNLTDLRSFDVFFGLKWNVCDWNKKSKGSCPAYKD
ncbi:MAG: DUF5723 family protein [Bacteroidetes bacterium]|nr:DUF5723 family protein [Bacteroidota bacterium]